MLDRLSIVIPAGPGDDAWQGLLPQLESTSVPEIVLVRTEQDDALTTRLPSNVREIRSVAGRARQLNCGAAASTSDWLWFLHADSRLTPKSFEVLARFIAKNRDAIGYFDLRFLGDGPALTAINTFGTWWRTRLFGLPFGDQGLLMPRRVFDALGGFDERLPSAEDHALVWTARRAGVGIKPVGAFIHTSARKYAERGWWKTTRQHLALTWTQARTFSRGDAR
ncbi:MAG: glycosyltransferase family 2 protein [Dokdonella sp.]